MTIYCPNCRYALNKHTPKLCPECGEEVQIAQVAANKVVSREEQTKQHAAGDELIDTLRTAMESLKRVVHQLERWRCEAKNWRDVAERANVSKTPSAANGDAFEMDAPT